jgi:chemotaxis signal transduction protein
MSASNSTLAPSFVLFQVGTRRVALSQDCVSELIASPMQFSFPHTTPLIAGVVLRRGRIVPVLDLGTSLTGVSSPPARFFLVAERYFSNISERCAIPVQGECELVTGAILPAEGREDFVTGCLNYNDERIDVLDLEKAIAAGARILAEPIPAPEAAS